MESAEPASAGSTDAAASGSQTSGGQQAGGIIVRPRKDGHVISNLTKDIVCKQLGINNVLHRQIYTTAKAYAVKHDLGTYREWRTIPTEIRTGIQDALEAEFDVLHRCERNWGASHFMLQAYGVLRSANARKRESESSTRTRLLRSESEHASSDAARLSQPGSTTPTPLHTPARTFSPGPLQQPYSPVPQSQLPYAPAPLLPPIQHFNSQTHPFASSIPNHPHTLPQPQPQPHPAVPAATQEHHVSSAPEPQSSAPVWYRQVNPSGVEYYMKVSRPLSGNDGAQTLGTTYTRQFLDERGREYYYNNLTRLSEWEPPGGGGLYVGHWERIQELPPQP